jgi:hypothetical protein
MKDVPVALALRLSGAKAGQNLVEFVGDSELQTRVLTRP